MEKRWISNREKTYRCSVRHFYRGFLLLFALFHPGISSFKIAQWLSHTVNSASDPRQDGQTPSVTTGSSQQGNKMRN